MKALTCLNRGRAAKLAMLMAFGVGIMLVPDFAYAAEAKTLGGLSDNIKGQFTSLKEMAFSFGYLAGVFLFVGGIYLIYKDSKQPGQDHAKKGFISMLVGVALLVAPTLIEIMTASAGIDTSNVITNIEGNAEY